MSIVKICPIGDSTVETNLMTKSFLLIIIVFPLTIMQGCAVFTLTSMYGGEVVDSETKAPIPGAAILAVYYTHHVLGGSSYVDTYETKTDEQGRFKMYMKPIFTFRMFETFDIDPMVYIFKPGYSCYPEKGALLTRPKQHVPGWTLPSGYDVTVGLDRPKNNEERGRNSRCGPFYCSGESCSAHDVPAKKMQYTLKQQYIERIETDKGEDKWLFAEQVDLVLAIQYNDITSAKRLVKASRDIENRNTYGRTLLMYAAELGRDEHVALLVERGAFVNAADNNGGTPLLFALGSRHSTTARYLIGNKADVNIANKGGGTPLMAACRYGGPEIAALLLEKGARLADKNEYGRTALFYASADPRTLALLISKGANVNDIDIYGRTIAVEVLGVNRDKANAAKIMEALLSAGYNVKTHEALILAININAREVIRLLLDKGADVNTPSSRGMTSLMFAVQKDTEIISWLLSRNADVNAANIDGDTALHMALLRNRIDIAKILISAGANVNVANKTAVTPLMQACQYGGPEITSLLLQKGARIFDKDVFGQTAIFYASADQRTLSLLISRGATVNDINSNGHTVAEEVLAYSKDAANTVKIMETLLAAGYNRNTHSALIAAISTNQRDVIRLLLAHDADVNSAARLGKTPLMYAAQRNAEVVSWILSRNVDVNAVDVYGDTALMLAVISNKPDIVKLLISNGANVNTVNTMEHTPLSIAVWNKHNDIVTLLKANGAIK